ncbi:hypothetical protein [Novosphingobium sp.]|uniref:hypothetical protein n=1 Tax=Novosphingobium sp. TaxID=1874826 RepID=UPI001DB3EA37|nr:hypothetical protein [Novosphingobium sp.]MBX9665390.1 hypothetical protein [Novosphingobium sp.]
MAVNEPLVEVSGLAKAFGGREVVCDVTIRVGAGDLLGLVGANGGGKTKTLRMGAAAAHAHRVDAAAGSAAGPDRPVRHRDPA